MNALSQRRRSGRKTTILTGFWVAVVILGAIWSTVKSGSSSTVDPCVDAEQLDAELSDLESLQSSYDALPRVGHLARAAGLLRAIAAGYDKLAVTVQADPAIRLRTESVASEYVLMARATETGDVSSFKKARAALTLDYQALIPAINASPVSDC